MEDEGNIMCFRDKSHSFIYGGVGFSSLQKIFSTIPGVSTNSEQINFPSLFSVKLPLLTNS